MVFLELALNIHAFARLRPNDIVQEYPRKAPRKRVAVEEGFSLTALVSIGDITFAKSKRTSMPQSNCRLQDIEIQLMI